MSILCRMRFLPITVMVSAILMLIASGCAFHKPRVKLDRVQLRKIDFEGLTTDFHIKIDNPNPIGITFRKFDYQLDMKDIRVLSGDQRKDSTIRPKDASVLTVPATIKYTQIWDLIQAVRDKDEVPYTFAGGIDVATPIGDLRIPFKKQGNMPVIRPPTVKLKRLKLESLDFSGADLRLDLKLKNPNRRSLGLKKLGWSLSLAGAEALTGSMNKEKKIAGGAEAILDLPIHIDFIGSARALYRALTEDKIDYRMKGKIDFDTRFGRVPLPYDLSGEVRLR